MKDLLLIFLTLAAFALVYYVATKVDDFLSKKKKPENREKPHRGSGTNSGYGNYRR